MTYSKQSLLSPSNNLEAVMPASKKWHTGNLIAFSHIDGRTDFQSGLVARTVENGIDFCYPEKAQLRFQLSSPLTECRITNDCFEAQNQAGENVRGVLVDAHHLLLEGAFEWRTQNDAIIEISSPNKTLIGVKDYFDPKHIENEFEIEVSHRLQWLSENKAQFKELPRHSQFTFMRALSQMKGQLCSPEGQIQYPWTTPDRWPHKNMWLWDTAFHAIGWRHVDAVYSQQMLDALLSVQASDGFIPHQVTPSKSSDITQPPILCLGVELVLEKTGDLQWLESIYPKLCAYVLWNTRNRDQDGEGLLEWHIQGDIACRSGESGMDNSSRFDDAILLDAPDFNAYQAGEYERLAQFATLLGKSNEASEWREHYQSLCSLINEKLWSEAQGLYCDRVPQTGAFSPILSSAGLLPIYCGAPSPEQAAKLVQHLNNPDTFGKPFPIPSIAVPMDANRDNSHINPYSKDMWRGPTWININWLVARGLRRYGYVDEAKQLRRQTLAELERTCEKWGTFFEYFDDRLEVEAPYLLRKLKNVPGGHPHQAIHDYGWSATLYVDWLLSEE